MTGLTYYERDTHPNIDVDRVAKRIMRDEWLITQAELESVYISHRLIAREFTVGHRQRALHVNGSSLSIRYFQAQPTIAPKRETEELRASAVKERVYHDWTHSLRYVHPNINVDTAAKRLMRDE